MMVLDPKERFKLAEESSLLKWFPVVEKLNIPTPETVIVNVPTSQKVVKEAARKVGYPLFLKTDLTAGKHHWDETCFVEEERDIDFNIRNLLDVLECEDFEAGTPFDALVFRKYIELDSKFKAFQGMPVARERRYFINNGRILCHHPYWIESAISFWGDTKEPKNWKQLLKEINTESEAEVSMLSQYARMVADVFKDDWAVDFAQAKTGTWYLIDMQRSKISFHVEGCQFIQKDYI